MKKIHLLFFLTTCINIPAPGQNIYIYGVNNKSVTDEKNAITRIEIRPTANYRFEIQNSVKVNDEWIIESNERIKIISENEYLIRKFRNGRMIDSYLRSYTKEPGEIYKFVEIKNETVKRQGHSTTQLPLCLEGEVIEYYHNGTVRSKSLYNDNQLVSNENWLLNGEKYIDDIFYSVDVSPTYDMKYGTLHNHLLNQFKKYNLADVSGMILIGFVILENGNMDGIQVVRGIEPDLDQIAVDALKSFPAKWTPAILNNSYVRCYCTMPINFMKDGRNEYFNFLEYSNGLLFYSH